MKGGVSWYVRPQLRYGGAIARSVEATAGVIFSLYLDQIIKPMSALHLIQFGSLAGDDKSVN